MSDKRESVKSADETVEKFDYFMCSVSGAVFAYVAQNYKAERIGINASTVELIGALFIGLSFYCGIRRLMALTVVARSKEWLAINTAYITEFLEMKSDSPDVNADIERRVAQLAEARKTEFKRCSETEVVQAEKFYNRRNWWLYTGLFLLLVSKVLQPYEAKEPTTPTTRPSPPVAELAR